MLRKTVEIRGSHGLRTPDPNEGIQSKKSEMFGPNGAEKYASVVLKNLGRNYWQCFTGLFPYQALFVTYESKY